MYEHINLCTYGMYTGVYTHSTHNYTNRYIFNKFDISLVAYFKFPHFKYKTSFLKTKFYVNKKRELYITSKYI